MPIYQRILAPIDGSPAAEAGLHEAIRLARDQQAQLRFFHVVDAYLLVAYYGPTVLLEETVAAMRQGGQETLDRAVRTAREQGVQTDSLIVDSTAGRVAPRIVEQARNWPADLIVLGTHGRRGVGHLVMGSDAEEVVRGSPVPVLLVRQPAGAG